MVKPLVPPMVDILGPYTSTPQHALARPGKVGDAAGAGFSWFQDCTDDNAEDGTPLGADFLNNIKAQLLTFFQESGIAIDNADAMLAYAVQSGGLNWAVATGTANAWAADPALAVPTYATGRLLWLKAPATNTSSVVNANVSGLGNRRIKRANGLDPAPSDLVGGRWYPTFDDGTNICIVTPLPSDARAAAMFVNRVVITATGAGSWIVPAGVDRIRTIAWGAGGGGGFNSNGGAPSGGASGGYGVRTWSVSPGDTVSFSNGVGGLGGSTVPAQPGQPGGNTTVAVGGVTMTVSGGQGGLNGTVTNGIANAPAGGGHANADTGMVGASGIIGNVAGSTNQIIGGYGAGAPLGGPNVPGGQGVPTVGSVPGGGGGASGSPANAGAQGARGEIWIEY